MAQRTTRNKIRWQVQSAIQDMRHLMDHLTQAAALAEDRSAVIDDNLSAIMASLDYVDKALKEFYKVL
jgi:hypothetical protein